MNMRKKMSKRFEELIKKARQEVHECNSSKETHDWIDWFEKELKDD